jgi:hypothetical protein
MFLLLLYVIFSFRPQEPVRLDLVYFAQISAGSRVHKCLWLEEKKETTQIQIPSRRCKICYCRVTFCCLSGLFWEVSFLFLPNNLWNFLFVDGRCFCFSICDVAKLVIIQKDLAKFVETCAGILQIQVSPGVEKGVGQAFTG